MVSKTVVFTKSEPGAEIKKIKFIGQDKIKAADVVLDIPMQ